MKRGRETDDQIRRSAEAALLNFSLFKQICLTPLRIVPAKSETAWRHASRLGFGMGRGLQLSVSVFGSASLLPSPAWAVGGGRVCVCWLCAAGRGWHPEAIEAYTGAPPGKIPTSHQQTAQEQGQRPERRSESSPAAALPTGARV
jgi:hypothetical protein